jgi:hypothetical protein
MAKEVIFKKGVENSAATFAYQEDIKELCRRGKETLMKLRLYIPGKL